jgi:hypothetical protein
MNGMTVPQGACQYSQFDPVAHPTGWAPLAVLHPTDVPHLSNRYDSYRQRAQTSVGIALDICRVLEWAESSYVFSGTTSLFPFCWFCRIPPFGRFRPFSLALPDPF